MSITIKWANSPREKFQVYRLRYQVYVEEDKKFQENPERMIKDQYDELDIGYNILATIDGEPIGTIRLLQDFLGLPPEEMELYKEDGCTPVKIDIEELRKEKAFNTSLINVGMLAVKEEHRHKLGLLKSLFTYLVFLCFSVEGEKIVATINYKIEKMMKNLGMKKMISEDKLWEKHINNYVVPIKGNLITLAKNLNYKELPFQMFDTRDLLKRKLYEKGEIICHEGKKGEEAFVITRGSVAVVKNTAEHAGKILATAGPGELIGEMAFLGEKTRSATLMANSRETELVTIPFDTLDRSLQDTKKMVFFLNFFGERLKNMNLYFAANTDSEHEPKYTEGEFLEETTPSESNRKKEFSSGEFICREEESGKVSWIIESGKVEVRIKDRPIKILGPGEVIGEIALINKKRTASLVARSKNTVLLEWDKLSFIKLVLENKDFRDRCLKTIFFRIKEMNRLNARREPEEETADRVVKALASMDSQKEMALSFRHLKDPRNREYESFGMEWLASETGCQSDHIAPIIRELKKKGVVTLDENGNIEIKNKKRLKNFRLLKHI